MHEFRKLSDACLEQLIGAHRPDGGWPLTRNRKQSAIEPTALALLALPSNVTCERDAAIRFLLATQNPNGSWPAFIGDDEEGCGLTGLVLYALSRCGVQSTVIGRAVRWLAATRGWESHWLWKWKFRTSDRHVRFDPEKFGWPWLPETASWVIPTAYALLALQHMEQHSEEDLLRFRVRRGVQMLYDRICSEGGWNAGNSVVYGTALAPHPDATALALLALVHEPFNDMLMVSLDWLVRRADACASPWTLAWAVLALEAFGRDTGPLINRLCSVVDPCAAGCETLAIVSLALRCGERSNAFRAIHGM